MTTLAAWFPRCTAGRPRRRRWRRRRFGRKQGNCTATATTWRASRRTRGVRWWRPRARQGQRLRLGFGSGTRAATTGRSVSFRAPRSPWWRCSSRRQSREERRLTLRSRPPFSATPNPALHMKPPRCSRRPGTGTCLFMSRPQTRCETAPALGRGEPGGPWRPE